MRYSGWPLSVPFIYGDTSYDDRERLYREVHDGPLDAIIISRVGNEGIDISKTDWK